MKKFKNIVKSGIFFLILCLLIFVLSFVFAPKDNTSKSGMHQVEAHGILGEKENSIDVIFMGDSESYTSFSPFHMYDEYGFTSYVIGVSAQRIYNQYYYLKDALRTQNPQVVVIETNTLFRKYSVFNAIAGEANNLIPFFQYHDRWKKMSVRDFDLHKDYTYTDATKGFRVRKGIDSVENKDYMKKNKEKVEVPYLNEYYVKRIKELCESRGIKVLLVSSKSLKNWNYGRHQGMSEMAERLNIDYIDLNFVDEIEIDWQKDTLDKGDHLNTSGALKVSSYMGDYLSKKYNLKDHKNDPYYSNWNIDLEKYKELIS